MKNSNHSEHRAENIIILTAGILTSAIGLLAMLGWILHLPLLASFGASLIPMAPSTASLFILIGLALSLRSRMPQNRGTYFVGLSIGVLVAVAGLLFFISSLAGIYPSIEHLGFSIPDTLNSFQIGHMSSVTAVSFVAYALAFLLTLSQSVERSERAWIALVLAFILVLTWSLFLFEYLLVTPLMYGGGIIPPSLPTSFAFLFLAIGLLMSAGLQVWPYNRIKDAAITRVSYVLLLIFILLAAGILTGGYFAFSDYQKNFRTGVEQQLSAIAELKVSQLVQWRKERLGDANVFYKNDVFSDLVKRYFKNQSDADAKKRIQAWMGQIAAAVTYNRACLHDIAGTERISFPQTKIHAPSPFSVRSAEVLKSGKIAFQDFYRDENDKKVYLTIFIPVLDENDNKKPLGVIALRIDPTQYLYPMIEQWPTPSRTSETLIIRRDGNDALFLNDLRFRKGAALNLRVPITNESMPAVKAALGQTGIIEGIDYRGVPVIADVRTVPDSPWFLVSRTDMEEVYAPLKERLWLMIILLGGLIIGAGVSVGIVWHQQRSRFYREQYKFGEALRENQELFSLFMRHSPVYTFIKEVTNTESRVLQASDNFQQLVGIPTQKIIGRTMAELFPPDFAAKITADDWAVASHGTVLQLDEDLNDRNYTTIKFPIDMGGKKLIAGYTIDITERKRVEENKNVLLETSERSRQSLLSILEDEKQAEESLRETTDYLESLLSFANAPIIVWDINFKITRFNLAFERLTGYTMYDVMGKHPEILVPTETRKDVSAYLARTSEGENLLSIEVAILSKDGDVRIVLWSTANIYSVDGKTIIATIAHGQDITERKQAEEGLRKSEERFRSLYENVTIGIYRTTSDGNILLANPALVKMLGYTSFEKLTERNLEKDGFESPSQRKEFLEKIERDGVVDGYESKWICQDGKAIFVLESARVIRDSHGKTLYYDGTVEDITERRQMEEGLRQMQKLEGLGTLAGGIAHDFNNILGIILAYITSITRFKDDTKKLDLAVATITKAVDRGKTLVQQILMFARKTETAFGAVNVNDVVMETVTMVMETFPKFITCSQNFDKSISYINADRSQLHQVLMNLCINARDAMPKGGVLTINTRMVSVASLRGLHPDAAASGYVCIEVSDTGEGMSEETQKRIFEPFFTTKGIGKGTGLGLAVVFGVAQTHKGFIDVESELGKGTTFRLYLPASQAAVPVIEKDEQTLEEITGGTETILVVEDEEMLMMSLQLVLVDKGYKVLAARDGIEALKIYQERKKDIALVMTDLGLPNISGLEVCQQIKKISPKERIILATGYLDPEMKEEFLKAGIQHFLFKPYDLTKVLKMVREVLDEK
jgi:PAS domain S-box-containing protein